MYVYNIGTIVYSPRGQRKSPDSRDEPTPSSVDVGLSLGLTAKLCKDQWLSFTGV